jgi:hypothetical protein
MIRRLISALALVLLASSAWAQFADNLDPFIKGAVCAPGAVPTSGLVAYWKLNETSGTRNDSVGGLHLTDNNTVGTATGKACSSSAAFVAANQEYLGTTDNATLSVAGATSFMFAAWVYIDDKTASRTVMAKATTSDEYLLFYNSALDRYEFMFADAGLTYRRVPANTYGSPATNTWTLVIGWYDAGAGTVNIQVNNGAVDSASTGGATPYDGTGTFQIGAYRPASTPLSWSGLIDEAGFWKSTVLDSSGRSQIWNGGIGATH